MVPTDPLSLAIYAGIFLLGHSQILTGFLSGILGKNQAAPTIPAIPNSSPLLYPPTGPVGPVGPDTPLSPFLVQHPLVNQVLQMGLKALLATQPK